MKKIFLSLVLIFTLLFNVFADNKQAHKELREAFENYGLLPEMIEKGFSLDKLDEIDDPREMRDYLQPFFMDENGMPLDNHVGIGFSWNYRQTKYGEVFDHCEVKSQSTQLIKWLDEYGTKKELLKKGYKEDEIFYYPLYNGEWNEKGYRVGKKYMGNANHSYNSSFTFETQKSLYTKIPSFGGNQFFERISSSTKEYLIIDLCGNPGGQGHVYYNLVESVKKMNPKEIYVLIDDGVASMGDYCALSLEKDTNISVTLIGKPTSGGYQGILLSKEIVFDNFTLNIKLGGIKWVPSVVEGIGVNPDIYTSNNNESLEVVKYLTKDYELKLSN